MAIETERDPRLYAVDDDPMRAAVVRNGRPVPRSPIRRRSGSPRSPSR